MARLPLRKVIRLRRRDWADLFAAQAALVRAQLLVWTRPPGALLTPEPAAIARAPEPAAVPGPVARLATAVARAARYGLFRPTCLVRAVALHRMLQARGFADVSLRIGVRRQSQELLAHAWVEYRGAVLADDAWRIRSFVELARMGLSQTP